MRIAKFVDEISDADQLLRTLTIIFLFLVSALSFVMAQDLSWQFRNLHLENGLSQSDVRSIFQDAKGYMWFGTYDGVNRYDGFYISNFKENINQKDGIKGQVINNFHQIDENKIAIGTYQGLNIYDYNTDKFTFYHEVTGNTRVIGLKESELVLLINNVVYRYYLSFNKFKKDTSLLAKQLETIYSTAKLRFNRSDLLHKNLYNYLSEQESNFETCKYLFQKYTIHNFIVDKTTGNLHLASDEGYIIVSPKDHRKITKVIESGVESILWFDNYIIAGTTGDGLKILNSTTLSLIRELKPTHSKYSLAGKLPITLYLDKQDNLWLGFVGKGVGYVSLHNHLVTMLLVNEATGIAESGNIVALKSMSNGQIWAASIQGLIYIYNQNYKILKKILPSEYGIKSAGKSVQSIHETKSGNIFILTTGGVYFYKNNKLNALQYPVGLDKKKRYGQSMIELNDTLGLIATRRGFLYINTSAAKLLPITCPIETKSNIYSAFITPKGFIYINNFFNSLNIYKYQQGQFIPTQSYDIKLNVNSVEEQNDRTILATTKGLMIIETREYSYKILTEADGLPNQNLYAAIPDHRDSQKYWCSSNNGIYSYHTTSNEVEHFGIFEGVTDLEFNSMAFGVMSNKDLLFGSNNGLCVIHNHDKIKNKLKNIPVLTQFKVGDQPASIYYVRDRNWFVLPYTQNSISANLQRINFPNFPEKIKYRLMGFSEGESELKNPGQISYEKLPPGKYEIQVKTTDTGSQWITLASITVLTPWYNSWIFRCVAIFALLALLWFYIKWRLKTMHKRNQMLEFRVTERTNQLKSAQLKIHEMEKKELIGEISRSLHDEIGTILSKINLQSFMAVQKMGDPQFDVKSTMLSIHKSTTSSLEKIRDLIERGVIEKKETALYDLLIDYIIPISKIHNITLSTNIDNEIASKVPANMKNELTLIIKEAVNNSIKYSNCSLLTVWVEFDEDAVILLVEDNGIGFDINNYKKGNGLDNIKFRAKLINAQLHISSEKNKGTNLRMVVPNQS
ncbi:MAG: hypothetical protein IPN29_07265 [Saprospiraceae bacterium]|nr:hypothetical protein [Saprospiraceae bacterium]